MQFLWHTYQHHGHIKRARSTAAQVISSSHNHEHDGDKRKNKNDREQNRKNGRTKKIRRERGWGCKTHVVCQCELKHKGETL